MPVIEKVLALEFIQLLTIVSVVSLAFVATSLDNLLILVVLMGVTRRRGPLVASMFASTLTVMLACASGLLIGGWLPPNLVGNLGLIPIGLGAFALWRGQQTEAVEDGLNAGSQSGWQLFGASFLLLLGNSGDSLAVFLPLVAESDPAVLVTGFVVWAIATVVWVVLAMLLSGNRQLARALEKRGNRLLPWMIIAVGVYILFNTATDTLS